MSLPSFGRLVAVGVLALGMLGSVAQAGPLSERIAAGKTIRLGFAHEIPWAYPGPKGKPRGFVNAHVLGVLRKMGYTRIEPVVTEWGGLIPGLKAGRFDIITGGMYILRSRCENIAFSEPMGRFGDALLVPKGNPKALHDYRDIRDKGAILVTGAGYNTIESARKEGVPDSQVMQVPGPTEILAAVRAGRADAGGGTYFTMLNLAKKSKGALEVTDPADLPEWTLNYVGIGFRRADADFVARFNAAQKAYLGSKPMLAAVRPYGYGRAQLPGDVSTAWACEHR